MRLTLNTKKITVTTASQPTLSSKDDEISPRINALEIFTKWVRGRKANAAS
jgi:hypothetical protein